MIALPQVDLLADLEPVNKKEEKSVVFLYWSNLALGLNIGTYGNSSS